LLNKFIIVLDDKVLNPLRAFEIYTTKGKQSFYTFFIISNN